MIKAVLDTNVLASGFANPGAPPGRLLVAWLTGIFELVIADGILIELERTFHKPYFWRRLGQERISANLELLRRRATLTPITTVVRGVATHPGDDVVLAAAVSAGADYLVTGDGPFRQQVGTYQGVTLISPREFMELLERAAST